MEKNWRRNSKKEKTWRQWFREWVVRIRSTPLFIVLWYTLLKEFFYRKPLKILFAPNGDGSTISFCSVELNEELEECILLSDSSIEVSGYSNGWFLLKKRGEEGKNLYILQDAKLSTNFFELKMPLKKVKPQLMEDLKFFLGYIPSSMLHLVVLLRKNAVGNHVLYVCETNSENQHQQWRTWGPIERIEQESIPTIEVPVIIHDEIVFLLKTQSGMPFKSVKIDHFSKNSDYQSMDIKFLNFVYVQDHVNLLVVGDKLSIAHTQQQYGIEIRSLDFGLRQWSVLYVFRASSVGYSPVWRIVKFFPRNELLIQTEDHLMMVALTYARTVYIYKAEEYGIVLLGLGL